MCVLATFSNAAAKYVTACAAVRNIFYYLLPKHNVSEENDLAIYLWYMVYNIHKQWIYEIEVLQRICLCYEERCEKCRMSYNLIAPCRACVCKRFYKLQFSHIRFMYHF